MQRSVSPISGPMWSRAPTSTGSLAAGASASDTDGFKSDATRRRHVGTIATNVIQPPRTRPNMRFCGSQTLWIGVWSSRWPRRRAVGRPLKVQSHVPVPLAENDPDNVVASQMLTPSLIAVCASMLKTSTVTESGRGRTAMVVGFVIVAALADSSSARGSREHPPRQEEDGDPPAASARAAERRTTRRSTRRDPSDGP
jgi:hypothetical protein